MKWSLDRVINLNATTKFLVDGITEVSTPDPLTVVIRLAASQPSIIPILSNSSLGILDSKVVMANGGDAGPDAKTKDQAEPYLNAHSPGTGPFILTSYAPNQEVVLGKNPAHWRGAPKIDRIVTPTSPSPPPSSSSWNGETSTSPRASVRINCRRLSGPKAWR